MGHIGFQEMILIFALALLIFGPRKLPELGAGVGKAIREFKNGLNEMGSSLSSEEPQERAGRNDRTTQARPPAANSPEVTSGAPERQEAAETLSKTSR